MSDNYVIKVCYFCDYPKNVSADYEENIDENGNYHMGMVHKYKDLWICYACSLDKLRDVNFLIQENGECCVCFEENVLLNLPTCTHKICTQCCKTIYYGSTSIDPPTISINDVERPEWPYPFYSSNEEEFKGTRKDWLIWDDKEAEYSDFTNKYFNEYRNPELNNKSYDELIALRDSLISENVEERLDWMNTDEFINYENERFCYEIVCKKIEKKWEKFNNKKTTGNGLCPICRATP
jgi:hypothetical protein